MPATLEEQQRGCCGGSRVDWRGKREAKGSKGDAEGVAGGVAGGVAEGLAHQQEGLWLLL